MEHAAELLPVSWAVILGLLGVIGGGLRWAVLRFEEAQKEQTANFEKAIAKQTAAFTTQLDKQDVQLGAIKDLLADEVFKLREMIHAIDKRVLTIEGHCSLYHGRGAPASRADYDPAPVNWRHGE